MANYSQFYSALNSKLLASTTLAAAITDDPTNHVRRERYACISKDGPKDHDLYLNAGPILYIIPSSCDYQPLTEQNAKNEGVLEMDVHSRVANATITTFTDHIAFVDDLVVELMQGADGTGGTPSWLSGKGIRLRASLESPEQLAMTEYRTKVKFRATLLPAV